MNPTGLRGSHAIPSAHIDCTTSDAMRQRFDPRSYVFSQKSARKPESAAHRIHCASPRIAGTSSSTNRKVATITVQVIVPAMRSQRRTSRFVRMGASILSASDFRVAPGTAGLQPGSFLLLLLRGDERKKEKRNARLEPGGPRGHHRVRSRRAPVPKVTVRAR